MDVMLARKFYMQSHLGMISVRFFLLFMCRKSVGSIEKWCRCWNNFRTRNLFRRKFRWRDTEIFFENHWEEWSGNNVRSISSNRWVFQYNCVLINYTILNILKLSIVAQWLLYFNGKVCLKLLSAIFINFLFFYQVIALQKLKNVFYFI